MLTNVLVILGINILFSFSGIVDFWGHIGGLIGGLAFSWLAGPVWEIRETPNGRTVVDTRSIKKSRIVAGGLLIYFLLMAAYGIYKKQ
jgi:rhomboid protease GluP